MTASDAPLNPTLSHPKPPSPRLQASVIIPARDEAHSIEAALEALARQRDFDGSPLEPARFEVTLLCNNCGDQTAAIARDFARNWPHLQLHVAEITLRDEHANVGAARRLLMDAACARLETAQGRAQGRAPEAAPEHAPRAICSTDADTRVSPTWIAAILAEIAAGAEAVGGRILVEHPNSSPKPDPLRAMYLRDTAYRLAAARLENRLDPRSADPAPRHFQFFGASLAITPRAYRQIGGLPRAACLEDVALERALMRADLPVRHSPHVRAVTSARQSGRVEIGLSTQLREWRECESHREWLVPSEPELSARWSARRALRALHARTFSGQDCQAEICALGQELRLNPLWLAARTRATAAFGALWDDVERALDARSLFRAQWPPVPVRVALSQLRARLEGADEK